MNNHQANGISSGSLTPPLQRRQDYEEDTKLCEQNSAIDSITQGIEQTHFSSYKQTQTQKKQQPVLNGQKKNGSSALSIPSLSKKRTYLQLELIPRSRFSQKQIFYLFADQLINLDFLKCISDHGNPDEYLKESASLQQFDGMKFISFISHRMDTKAIEFFFELIEPYSNCVSAVIDQLRKMSDRTLYQFADSIEKFWSDITSYKSIISDQYHSQEFQEHWQARMARSNLEMDKITKQISPSRLIQYTKYSTDYAKQGFDSRSSGYTTALYELIAGNAYAFKEMLQQRGYHDAVYSKNRLSWCLEAASLYFKKQAESVNLQSKFQFEDLESQIVTLDNFMFPIILKTTVYNLDYAYDKENGLLFQINDILAIYEFELKDPSIVQELNTFRKGSKFELIKELEVEEQQDYNKIKENVFKTMDPLFFQKYYQDDIPGLLKRGSKWNKLCGTAPIPTKKIKSQTQNPFTS